MEITNNSELIVEEKKQENPNMVYGRLAESVHISGYSLERAMREFEYLLDDNRWQLVGKGYDDINEFVRSLSFAEFKIAVEQRKKIANKLKKLEASQRATAEMLGVGVATINRDTVPFGTINKENVAEYQEDEKQSVPNEAPEPETPLFSEPPDQIIKAKEDQIHKEQRKKENEDRRNKMRSAYDDVELTTDKKYRIIYADPPWMYDKGKELSDKYGDVLKHYPPMETDDICALPVGDLCDDNCVLFMWATAPKLPEALQVIESWGFQYKTNVVWDKVKHNFGYYFSVRHEHLLIAGRGSSTPDISKLHDSVISIERSNKHSEKPEYFRELIDSMYTSGNKIELFARKKADGWDTWGNEI